VSIRPRSLSDDGFPASKQQEIDGMAVQLNRRACEHAARLIEEGKFIADERESWAEHHPSSQIEEEYIEKNGFLEYGKWFFGINDEYSKDRKRYYELLFGDFENVHRCSILAAQSRAVQDKHSDVENAAADLLAMIDKASGKK
jgi:hypothetical protein